MVARGSRSIVARFGVTIFFLSGLLQDSFACSVDTLHKRKESYYTGLLYFNTVEPQWLKHLWDHGKSFERWIVRATEC